MTRLRALLCRLSGLLRKGNLERDMNEELDFHLQMEIAENLRRGMTPDQARSTAMRCFGGVTQVKEDRHLSPRDPPGVRVGIRGDDDRFVGSVSFARLARDPDRSRPGVAGLMLIRGKAGPVC